MVHYGNLLSMKVSSLPKPTTVLFMIQFVVDPLPLQKKVAFVPSGTACDSGETRISAAGRKVLDHMQCHGDTV